MAQVIDSENFVDDAVSIISSELSKTDESKKRLSLCGGNTPRPIYEALTNSEIYWDNIEVTFGDERCVPPSHKDSNFKMASEALLSKVPINPSDVIRIKGELDPSSAAIECEEELQKRSPNGIYKHDLLLLGMGGDGHTASLFPETPALNENKRWVIENYIPQMECNRITLTYPLINASKRILILVTGEEKKKLVRSILSGESDFPISRVSPSHGKVTWLLG